ncbi:MAG: hypothetical protein AVDCRST_MAG91-1606, partial [uncultured Sphingomonadaceae bacterium]
ANHGASRRLPGRRGGDLKRRGSRPDRRDRASGSGCRPPGQGGLCAAVHRATSATSPTRLRAFSRL